MLIRLHPSRARRAFPATSLSRAVLVAGLSLGAGAASLPVHAQSTQAASRHDVPAGPLDRALNQFAAEAGVLLAVDASVTAGKMSPGLSATVTVEEGLRRLLAGTGLEAVKGERGYGLKKASTPAPAPARKGGAAEAILPTVTVQAAGGGVATTEGTHSYAAGPTATATGLGLSIRDTPQSVTVVTRERIDDQAMTTVADALNHTTGVSLKAVDRGRNNLSVRGFEVTSFQFDGIPFATGNIGIEEQNTIIYDRIEVVRGATGLTSGAGEPSAAINLVRKHADSKTFTGWASVELGSWDRRAATADLTTPLNEDASVRARVVLHAYRQDAFVDLEKADGTVFYGVVDADLSPNTHLSLGASEQRDERSGVLWYPLPFWYADGTRTDWDRSKTSATRWNRWDTTEQTAFATLKHVLPGDWTVRADVSYHRQVEDSDLLWFSGNPDRATGLGMSGYPYHYLAKPRQLHLAVTAAGPFEWLGRRHELTAGLMRSRLDDSWSNRDPVGDPAPVGNFNAWDGSYPEPEMGQRYIGSKGTTTQTAAYAAARWQLTDALKLITGARLSSWKREEGAGAWTPSAYTIEHDSVLTPYAGLIYDLGESISAYASYTDIFNPQTKRDRNGDYLDPLEGRSYEAGLKGGFFDDKLNASAAVFRIEQDNFAVPDEGHVVPGTETQASRPAEGTVAKGYEIEVAGDLTRDWNLSLGWTHFSAKDADGAHVASHHPRKMLKLATKHTLHGGLQGLSVGGALRWEDRPPKRGTNPAGVEEATGQPAYALVDLMARYEISPQWSAQLNVYNVFDRKYYTSSGWWDGVLYGEPRNARLTLKYQF